MDIIRLINMSFYAYHGVSAAEKETGRRYEVDCDLYLDLTRAAASDKLTDTVNYAKVYETVESVIADKKYSLIESLAAEICKQLLTFEQIESVRIKVRKKMPPIPGNLDYIEVEMQRSRR
jgi:dihydroneopterin aldolase